MPDPDRSAAADLHLWQVQAVRDLLLVAAVVGVFWAGYVLRAVTVPLLVALLLAYLAEPIIQRLCRGRNVSRVGAVSIVLVSGVGAVAVVLAILVPLLVANTVRLVNDFRGGELRQRVETVEKWVPDTFREEFEQIIELLPAGAAAALDVDPAIVAELEEAAADDGDTVPAGAGPLTRDEVVAIVDRRLSEQAAAAEADGSRWLSIARGGAETIIKAVGTLIGIGLLAFLIPFYFFFFSTWYPAVLRFGRSVLPEKNKARTLDLLARMDSVVAGFVRGRIVISVIMGVLLAIGWKICGVPYAVLLGLVIGVFCAVPYLGVIGIPVAVGLLFFEELGQPAGDRMAWWAILLWPTLVFGAVQLIEGYVLTPLIAGKATNLDPVTILVAVLAGGSVLGVYGMLLAIPAAACGKILFTEVLLPKIRDWAAGRAADPLPIDRS